MADVLSPRQRSYCMSQIRASHTKPERQLRSALWAAGLRFRVRQKLPGRPDIIFTRRRLVIFVDGCFWHCCPVHGREPTSNKDYWGPKLERNRRRDAEVNDYFKKSGWLALRFWEHEVNERLDSVVKTIIKQVSKRESFKSGTYRKAAPGRRSSA